MDTFSTIFYSWGISTSRLPDFSILLVSPDFSLLSAPRSGVLFNLTGHSFPLKHRIYSFRGYCLSLETRNQVFKHPTDFGFTSIL